jgi:hypothetical protein
MMKENIAVVIKSGRPKAAKQRLENMYNIHPIKSHDLRRYWKMGTPSEIDPSMNFKLHGRVTSVK